MATPESIEIQLRRGKAQAVRAGHPWVFSGAIAKVKGPRKAIGVTAVVRDDRGELLGWGAYNGHSQIAVRMLARGEEIPPRGDRDLAGWLQGRLDAALAVRAAIGIPGAGQGAWRLCNAEGDGLSGLTIDRVGDGAIVVASTAMAARWLRPARDWLAEHGCAWVAARVARDAHPSEGLDAAKCHEAGTLAGEAVPARLAVSHHGITLIARPGEGAKAGLFTDQWFNHLRVAELARDRYVVDAYCHGGGFGQHAARAGARRVLCVDASAGAIELARAGAEESGLDAIETVVGDAIHTLRDLADGIGDGERPDLVVVDPPKFATRADVVRDALRKYTHLNATAMAALGDGGLLVSCSCSGRVGIRDFERMLAIAADRVGRTLRLIELRGAGPDHPTAPAHAEGRYLKVALCAVSPR